MASSGFIELVRLADLAKARATGRHASDHTQWIGVAFEVSGQQFVAPIGEVSEVLLMPELTPIPLTKPWLLGVANVRGRLLPLVDLAEFLNIDGHERLKNKKVMVVDQESVFSGILVDQVLGVTQFSGADYQAVSLPEDSPFAPYNHGRFVKDGKYWHVIMPSLLFADNEYLNAAKN